jgi:hypothetical protein
MSIIKITNADTIPNLPTSKITSGTFADARIASSNVSQHVTSFDDNDIVNDLSTLGLRVHTQENLNVSNSNSASFDVFQDSTGITSLTNVANVDEYLASVYTTFTTAALDIADYSSTYSATATFTQQDGNLGRYFDNSYASGSSSTGWYLTNSLNGNSAVNANITVDLGSSNAKYVEGFRIYQDNTASFGSWKTQGSNNNSDYTDLGSSFEYVPTAGSGTQRYFDVTFSNDTLYRYIRLLGVSGTLSNSQWHTELQFKTKTASTTANATGSFEGATITAGASTSSMGAVITYQDNAGTNTLNTDIVLKLSADNGSNYSTATLTALPDFATGIKMAKVNDLSVTAGTQLKYKIELANQASGSKEARIRGVSLQF